MIQTLKNAWHDPVWSKVIATIIVAAGAGVTATWAGWWPAIGRAVAQAWASTVGTTPTPNWLLAVLAAVALRALVAAVARCWRAVFVSQGSSWTDYKTDLFEGLRWRWEFGRDGSIYSLHSFCPACDYQVHPTDIASFRAVVRIGYFCNMCRRKFEFDESPESLESRVRRRIQQKLRTGTWRAQTGA